MRIFTNYTYNAFLSIMGQIQKVYLFQEAYMKTSVIGFPRVGADRELKFASEKYFWNDRCLSFIIKNVFLCVFPIEKQMQIQ